MTGRRVVVTGMGIVGPLGNNGKDFWQGIREGRNGIDQIRHFDTTEHKCCMGAEVKGFEFPDKRAAKRLDETSQYALVAAKEAMDDSGLEVGRDVDPYRVGTYISTGVGGIQIIESEAQKVVTKGVRFISPLMVPTTVPNMVAGNVSIEFGAKGASFGIVSACASGNHSLGEAFRSIVHGYHDVMIAGGTEASFAEASFAGFANMKALSKRTDRDRCCTPFDKERDGFIMAEGSAILILEELEHAQARGAKIYAEIVGYGATSDAYHITMPDPEGEADAKAMTMAMEEAGIGPSDISYINAHGTGTPMNDKYETAAIKRAMGEQAYKIPVSSTKSMTGHALGAAGAIEAFISIRALNDGFIPATINYRVPDEDCDLDIVPNEGRNAELKYVLSNALGFGGHNGVVIFKKWED